MNKELGWLYQEKESDGLGAPGGFLKHTVTARQAEAEPGWDTEASWKCEDRGPAHK